MLTTKALSKELSAVSEICQTVVRFKDSITSYHKAQEASFPVDIAQLYGRGLSVVILLAYQIRKNVKNSAIRNESFAWDTIRNESFAWDIVDIEAVHAFRAEAFEVAHIQTAALLQVIKESVAVAIEEGISYGAWKDDLYLKGFEPDNPYHLRTNFNTGISNAQLASRWQEIQDTKDFYPYLKYVVVNDDRLREEHAALNGLVALADDPVWDEIYPPNGWNCRCDVEQLTSEDAYKDPGSYNTYPLDVVDEDFRKNTGKELSIWGKWIDRQERNSYSANQLELDDMKSVPAPAPVEDPSKYFTQKLSGIKTDMLGFPVYMEDITSTLTNAELSNLSKVKPTIADPEEVWYKDGYYTYIKKFSDGSVVVETFKGSLLAFRLYVTDSDREGILIFKK